jgi:hypothetical protein
MWFGEGFFGEAAGGGVEEGDAADAAPHPAIRIVNNIGATQ